MGGNKWITGLKCDIIEVDLGSLVVMSEKYRELKYKYHTKNTCVKLMKMEENSDS